jgi:DNA-directed RNA polymerase specialized sigma24 family protein
MRKTKTRPTAAEDCDTDPPVGVDAEQTEDPRLLADALAADARLAERCIAGDVAAWDELYAGCHDRLSASIVALLGGRSDDPNFIDEIAAQVWYALVKNDGELLLRFDPARGARLITFIQTVAKDIWNRHRRSERRRLDREGTASCGKSNHYPAELDRANGTLTEFLESLAPRDRQFFNEHLLENPDQAPADESSTESPTSIWQRTRRIYKRLLGFLNPAENPD